MTRKYTGNSDGVAPGKRPGTEEFLNQAKFFYKFKNLGTWAVRQMNNDASRANPLNPKYLSVHATGRAIDLGYSNRAKAIEACSFFATHAETLGIEEIHDYSYKGPAGVWGRGWRCSRNSWKIYDSIENAGTPGGKWLHIELSPEMANSTSRVKASWEKAILGK